MQGLPMTREELLDQIAIEVLKNLPHNFARDAYNIAEGVLERRDAILHKWALTEAIVFDGIEKLNLTVRSERCLKADEVYTLTQLLGCTKDRLLKTPNMGRKSVNEIIEKLAEHGLKLKGEA
jgi:DNA-directed RNA polymerase alpha subunit